jgi:hypothetical protein
MSGTVHLRIWPRACPKLVPLPSQSLIILPGSLVPRGLCVVLVLLHCLNRRFCPELNMDMAHLVL